MDMDRHRGAPRPAQGALAPALALVLTLSAAACTVEMTPSPSAAITESPSASPSPSPSPTPTPSPTPLANHCPGADKTPGKPAGRQIADRSENWAGYIVYDTRARVTCVEGSWLQPTVSCPSSGQADVAIWVGIDGVSSPAVGATAGSDLIQIGTQAGCKDGQRGGFAWYQVIPLDELSVEIPDVPVSPGDRMRAMVSFTKGAFTLLLVDVTSGASFSTEKALSDAALQTAEWIVEAPMIGCPSKCVIAALPRFGKETFSSAFAAAGPQRGAIDDDTWTHGVTSMVRANIARASVSGLTSEGTAFSVTWKHR